jgi:hypothetical protein
VLYHVFVAGMTQSERNLASDGLKPLSFTHKVAVDTVSRVEALEAQYKEDQRAKKVTYIAVDS